MTIDRDLWNQIVKTLKSTIAFISVGSILRILLFPAAVIAEVEPQALISPESIRVHHDALVNISSKAGGLNSGVRLNEAGNLAAQYLLNGYKEAGLENVRFEPFYPNRWWPESYDLTIIGDQNTPDQKLMTFPVWYCEKAYNLELEVVYAGFGTAGELRGLKIKDKAVLIDMKRLLHFVPSWHKELTNAMGVLKEEGAKAVITAETRIETPTGSVVGDPGKISNQKAQKASLFPLPVFAVGKSDAQKLKDRIRAGTTEVRMNLRYSLKQTKAVNIVADLPGNGKVDEYIIIGGHYDSWFDGAIDNLGSQAALLEMARYFNQIPQKDRNRHMMFVSLFGHELSNHAMGQAAFVEKRADILGRITCFLDVDGSGSWGWEEIEDSGEIIPTQREDKGAISASSLALSSLAHKSIYHHYRQTPATWLQFPLNFFVSDQHENIGEAGIPTLLVISKHIYYHSTLDTIDRISPEQVYRRTLININIIQALLDSPPGYYIGVDTNPHRVLKAGERVRPDLNLEQLPENPTPWQTGPPAELAMHIIPTAPKVFSPVIVWCGYWTADNITDYDAISWDFRGVLGLMGPKKGFFGGTMYFLPGNKRISMSITDGQGRTSTVYREFTVKAGRYAIVYLAGIAGLGLLAALIVRKVGKKQKMSCE